MAKEVLVALHWSLEYVYGMQPGDVKETYADIADSQNAFGYDPKTPIDVGIPRFIEWFKSYHGVN